MNHFEFKNNELFAENVNISELAKEYGTPLYVYSAATFRRHFKAFDSAFNGLDHLTCFSVKANSNLSLLKLLAEQGAGMDIVSGGELYRALKAGVPANRIVYSGVGKKAYEIAEALKADILMFNVESVAELHNINEVAISMNKTARISFRINPDVDPKTHPYISTGMKKNKFGLDMETALTAYQTAKKLSNIEPIGMDCHIGSQLTTIEPFLEALDKLLAFKDKLSDIGIEISHFDLGGGLGITYDDEQPPHPKEFGEALTKALEGRNLKVILEPGRVISGNAGILVTEVIYTKSTPTKNFLIVDAGMNDLIRPSLYQSFHNISEVVKHDRSNVEVDVVGPICESGDFLAHDRELPEMKQGELLAVYSAGAYGFTMSSNYNSRLRAAEIIVDGDDIIVARRRETYEDLLNLES
ncbi:diaminopimelate decarboxylase [Desulfovibrio gilichinskyi]|uniref:Diaminopimelate decarboxylase n=1 Tax=Desulfovibrio gilichinskyi TaxID=1519643 RepID=A0A1X7CCP4_9BACT|nr:diaminopimelate decarboxylase [Desulfovibrio gilichinskyi]SME93894.1 diaminopimelate decarboxylase [Desulfovibrio gilichinskyi]